MEDMDRRLRGVQGRRINNVGGTAGGLGSFVLGAIMTAAGGYLLLNQVTVTTGFWTFFGYNAFGLSLVPLLFGIMLLFYNGRGILGWLLVVGGLAIVAAGILANLTMFFQPTSLFNTLIMLILFVGGLGLIGRSLLPRG
jgi:hypothetical protein